MTTIGETISRVRNTLKAVKEEMADAIKFAHEAIKVQIAAQLRLAEAFGKKEVREYETAEVNEDLQKRIHDLAYDKCYAIAKQNLVILLEVTTVKLKKKLFVN